MAIREPGNHPLGPYTEGTVTDPSSGDPLAETETIPQTGTYELRILAGASAATSITLARRNADDDADVGEVVTMRVPVSASGEWIFHYRAVAGELFRVAAGANLTGDVEAAIWAERLS